MSFYRTHPDVNEIDAPDDREMVRCDRCESLFEDGTGLGRAYLCTACYYDHPVVIGGVMAAIKADERAGK